MKKKEQKTVTLQIRVSEKMKRAIEKRAKAELRTVSDFIRWIFLDLER